MKKINIILLIFIAAAIAVLTSFLQTATTYDSIETAKSKPGKFVHVMAKLDLTQKVEYDAINNPNYLKFTVVDSTGQTLNVVYHNAKPDNLEISDKLVLKGKYEGDHFECKDIQTKCPSKYKDDMKATKKSLPAGRQGIQSSAQTAPAEKNSAPNKY